MMRVSFTPQAAADLEEIADYIALDNPARAVTFIREIRRHCEKIAQAPAAYPARPELGEMLRSCAHGRYVIFFKAFAREVLIVRIIHGSRDLPALLD